MIEKIEVDGVLLAIVVRDGFEDPGVNFFTSDEDPLQLGVLKHGKGHVLQPHVHRAPPREIGEIQEVLVLMYGRVRVDFYDDNRCLRKDVVLNRGDTILLMRGGHGFEMLEDSKMIEVKQGPYFGVVTDKERFEMTRCLVNE